MYLVPVYARQFSGITVNKGLYPQEVLTINIVSELCITYVKGNQCYWGGEVQPRRGDWSAGDLILNGISW